MDWGASYQYGLERSEECTVTDKQGDRIEKILQGMAVSDSWFKLVTRYRMNSKNLKIARMQTGLSQKRFADSMNWGLSYQARLEGGGVKTVSDETAKSIVETLVAHGFNNLGRLGYDPGVLGD